MINSSSSVEELASAIFAVSPHVRYVAILHNGDLLQRQRAGIKDASSSESDRYEELFVNRALLTSAKARGDLDCGGLAYLLVRYGNFFQLIVPGTGGHLSVCIDQAGNPIDLQATIRDLYTERFNRSLTG